MASRATARASAPPSVFQRQPGNASSSKLRFKLVALATACSLSGCSLGPNYQHPETIAPTQWHAPTAEAAAGPVDGWWKGFGSAELDDYVDQARRANNDLGAAIARVREADAQAGIAGAPLLPTVNAGLTTVRERVQANNSLYQDFHQTSPQLSASYVLDFWGKNRAAQRAAMATASAARHDQAVVELTVVSAVTLNYFQTLALRERLSIAESNLAAAQTILIGLQRQRVAGIATALDVAQQETVVATLSAAVPPLAQQLRQTVDALAILLARMPSELEASQRSLNELKTPAVAPGLPSTLLARRPDVAEAEDQLMAANANIAVARASFYPSIALTASGGLASSALSTLLTRSAGVFSLGAGLAQPIFDGGLLKGQYELARARYDELLSNYRKTVLGAFGNVEDALIAVQQTELLLERQGRALASARRANDIAQRQLASGVVNVLAVLGSETALYNTRDALVQAQYAHLQALVNLYGALGGGWQNKVDKS